MLEALCGNKNIQKILLFLFVNGKGYGTQLHRILKTPLTPLQKALNRLEKGGIIISYFEGKTRLYQFNPAYPLLNELEQLLKKAYTLLPAYEKKSFSMAKEVAMGGGQKIPVLFTFWERLKEVKHLAFTAKTKSSEENGWNGRGNGEVEVVKESHTVLIFHEKGTWKGTQSAEMNFKNIFRWTLDRHIGVISLEHLRRGLEHPVFLFHLAPSSQHSLSSVDSHLCEEDAYFGHIHFEQSGFRLSWRVIGPKKNEELFYYYS